MKKQYKKLASMGKYTTKFHRYNRNDDFYTASREITNFAVNAIVLILLTCPSMMNLYGNLGNKLLIRIINLLTYSLVFTFASVYIIINMICLYEEYFGNSAKSKNLTLIIDKKYKTNLPAIVTLSIIYAFIIDRINTFLQKYHYNSLMTCFFILIIIELFSIILIYNLPELFFKMPKSKNNKKWKHHKI